MAVGMSLVIALTAAHARTAIPVGTLRIPAGCAAPARIPMVVDAFLGTIDCPHEELSIAVFGGAMVGPPCEPLSDGIRRPQVQLKLTGGRPITMCTSERRAAGDGK